MSFPVGTVCKWKTRRTGPISLRIRFSEKWLPHPGSRCWIWVGCRDSHGYGVIGDGKGKVIKASRASWKLHEGYIPSGLCVLHRCDNPPCVNPDHLFLGSKKDNTDDMVRKGRARHVPSKGERNGMAKLTRADIDSIRSSPEGPVALAKRHGVGYQHIWQIRRGLRWR